MENRSIFLYILIKSVIRFTKKRFKIQGWTMYTRYHWPMGSLRFVPFDILKFCTSDLDSAYRSIEGSNGYTDDE
jgi:hypothetical protein